MDWKTVNFDWNRARAFLVTVEEGSLSAGARALGLTQPTLGRQVAALESELGVTLFERVGQGLKLTDAGLGLVAHVQAMGEAASRLSLAASGQSQTLQGTVTIAVSELEAVFMLPAVIERLRSELPGITLNLQVSHEVANLKQREADIALRSCRPTQPDLIVRKLREDPIWLYGTAKYLAPYQGVTSARQLNTIQIIGFEQNNRLQELLNSTGHGWSLSAENIRVATLSQLLQWELVKRHLGLGLFPQPVGDQEPAFARAFESFGPPMVLPLWLVCHRELHTSLRVRKVFDLLAEMLSG
ncbi:LysR family transcriptional regulator [uncultured Amphritea sp.]|uniref:LysR family transcriptional regulator n=1 Tax=uncultured Amphritea sp. TaxID=981605 RepID=UPI0026366C7F|nr:LysR family transcriptional regulator [uncultured Amphritea sp.]